jgi:ADP-ribose pyrophosphatase YjhB (NUDIX family)
MSTTISITNGKWGDTSWQFIAHAPEPAAQLCTAAFCVVTYQGKVVLVEHKSRGYEFTGGHIDLNEEIEKTVVREVREESRAVIETPQFFGYKKISPIKPIPHRDDPDRFYPFPHSYVPYYFAEASKIVENEEVTQDINSVRLATYAEAVELLQPGHNHQKILDYLVRSGLITVRKN